MQLMQSPSWFCRAFARPQGRALRRETAVLLLRLQPRPSTRSASEVQYFEWCRAGATAKDARESVIESNRLFLALGLSSPVG